MGRVLVGLLLLGLCACARVPSSVEQWGTAGAQTGAKLAPTATQPFLRLETGGHTAKISRIAVDAAGQYLVTGSSDKTARVWRLADGALLQTLRPPIGEGDEGKIYAVAISPDGGVVAVGGFTGPDGGVVEEGLTGADGNPRYLYLFDRASGRLLHTLGGLPTGIADLSFSQDGRYLAAGLTKRSGIRVFRSSDGQEAFRDTDYQDSCYSVDFDGSGRLVTTSYDGFIRLYDTWFKLRAKQPAPGGKDPFIARFSPDGRQIAVGFDDSTAVNVLSGQDLSLLYAPDTRQANNGNLGSVAWSADGSQLLAGGTYDDGPDWNPVLRWGQAGRNPAQSLRVSTDVVMDLRPLSGGRMAFGTGDPRVGVLNAEGGKVWERTAEKLDLRGSRIDKLRVSADGSQVEFGFISFAPDGTKQKHRVFFDLAQRQPSVDQAPASGLSAPNTEGEASANWANTDHLKIHGQPLALQPYEISRSLALASKPPGFLLGTEWFLRYYDTPQTPRWAVPVPDVAWAVNLSGDGRYALAAYGDGTIRWHKTGNGEEVLALFVHPDGKRWIAWTPQGFYDAAPGAEGLIGYHLNQGREHEGQFVAAGQMEKRFFRPDLIARRLSADGDRLMAQAQAELGDVRQTLADGLPPELELVSSQLDGFELVLEYRLKPRNGGVGRVELKVNDVARDTRALPPTTPGSNTPMKIRLPLPAGQPNKVELLVYNSHNSVASTPLSVSQTTPAAVVKPTLYVLAIGVSEYKDPGLKLKYAAADAQAVSTLLAQRGQALFNIAPPIVLPDSKADLAGIKAAFAELAQRAKENDVFLLYMAGHAAVFEGTYHFIPQDDIYRSEKDFRAASLDEQGLQDLLKTIRAQKSLIFLDTCFAGAAVKLASVPNALAARGDLEEKTAITKLMRATGRTVLMASSDKTMAFEGYQGHGIFSYVLLEGLQGKADTDHNGEISTLELAAYVSDRVPQVSHDRQFPIHESNGNVFPIGYVRGN